jgi:3,4-dihydroxy 2-butanone 4-phosphate synthase/GTP cyclohydrolase II
MVLGKPKEGALVRVHSQCITGDTFFSFRCDCGEQLRKSFEQLKKEGSGVLLYLGQEGRGIGLTAKIQAYALQDRGYDTVEANHALGLPIDARDYKIAADMLKDLGLRDIALLTNNPDKEKQLSMYGIRITKSIALETTPNSINKKYLRTKKQKMQHRLRKV